MRLVSDIWMIDTTTGEDVKVGEVYLEEGVIKVEPDTEPLRRLAEAHIVVGGEEVRPGREPEAFVRGLSENYRSAYFRAAPAEQRA
jgi:hypothetical protein